MRYIVGVADMHICTGPDDLLVTHALGSCLGLAAHDPVSAVGGLLHVMLPDSHINESKAQQNPCMFVDSGVPRFFKQLYAHGAVKQRLVVKVAGGAAVQEGLDDRFHIGKRNWTMLKKLFWMNNVLIAGADVGGARPRTMYLEIGSGRVWINCDGQERTL